MVCTHLIIGGTGTLGKALVKQLTHNDPSARIAVFSRGELAQQQMKQEFPKLDYIIGDVRDRNSLRMAMRGVRNVFHLAALKHVDVVEDNPMEAIKINVDGTKNVAEIALACDVKRMIFSSTDKAVLPINVYGMTKAISEKYLMSLNHRLGENFAKIYRWGNVIGSRGSAIPNFVRQIQDGKPVQLTNVGMTRFWIRIEDAARFMATTYGELSPSVRLPPDHMKAASVLSVIHAIAEIIGRKPKIEICGIRPGEKLHECLLSTHELCINSNTCDQYSHKELIDLLEPTVMEVWGDR